MIHAKRIIGTAMLAIVLSGFASTQASAGRIARWCKYLCQPFVQYSAAYGGQSETITVAGNAGFDEIGSTEQPWTRTLVPTSFAGQGQSQFYGVFNTSLDPTRIPTNTTVGSNQAAAQYPATGDIHYYNTITFSALQGIRFRSMGEHHLQNTHMNSWDPQNFEQWVQVGTIDYEDVNRPGVVAFTLVSLTVTIS